MRSYECRQFQSDVGKLDGIGSDGSAVTFPERKALHGAAAYESGAGASGKDPVTVIHVDPSIKPQE